MIHPPSKENWMECTLWCIPDITAGRFLWGDIEDDDDEYDDDDDKADDDDEKEEFEGLSLARVWRILLALIKEDRLQMLYTTMKASDCSILLSSCVKLMGCLRKNDRICKKRLIKIFFFFFFFFDQM